MPMRDTPPSKVSLDKLSLELHSDIKKNLPKKEELQEHQHPKTMDADKYFVGDRFHDKKYPHKSELCRYHDINLCPQLKGAKTSGQENLNSTRNRLRLRSTCTQKLSTHLFYNGIVMDRAHYRQVVKKQASVLDKSVYSRHKEWLHVV